MCWNQNHYFKISKNERQIIGGRYNEGNFISKTVLLKKSANSQNHRNCRNHHKHTWTSCASTQKYIEIATVSLTTFCTPPILIPDVSAIWHILASYFFTCRLCWTSLWNIILFLSSLRPVRGTSPLYLCQTHIFSLFASLYGVQALLTICLLICAHITFKTFTVNDT